MSEILIYYRRPDPTTWVYMSSFLTIGLYFVFHRFWSVRNLDIALLILLAPGLLMVHEGMRRELRELETEQIAERARESLDGNVNLKNTSLRARKPRRFLVAAPSQSGDDDETDVAVETDKSEGTALVSADPGQLDGDVEIPSATEDVGAKVDLAEDAVGDGAPNDEAGEQADAEDIVRNEGYYSARAIQRHGFVWLFVIQACLLVRLLLDPLMIRRPLLNPNLATGGLYFISISLFIFMMGNVVTSTPRMQVLQGPKLGPGYALMHRLPAITTRPVSDSLAGADSRAVALNADEERLSTIAKALAILAHLAIISGIVLIGNRHFGNLRAGVGAATLYLMLPYTAQMTGRVDHALPAALLLWAILMYRKPFPAGIMFGLAAGLVYYPLFLLPLWCSFYWRRGVRRFGVGVVATLAILMLLLSVGGTETLLDHLRLMFGLRIPETANLRGIWGLGWNPIWRLPVIVGFAILCTFFAVWPSPKNLGTLISCSAAVMVAAQFWHGYGGGLYVGWYLPLLLLTIFRPNLQDRVALKVVAAGKRDAREPQVEATPA